jgi:hypothetical protein
MLNRIARLPARLLRRGASRAFRYAHNRLVASYCRPPSPERERAIARWFGLRNRLSATLIGREGTLTRWCGTDPQTGQPLTVLYFGNRHAVSEKSPEYLQSILFGGEPAESEALGSLTTAELERRLTQSPPTDDLVIIERNRLERWLPPDGEWFQSPVWVRQVFEIDPSAPWEAVEQRLRGQKRNLRLVRRHGFTARISRDEADFEQFYDRMHVPLIQSRHAEYGTVSPKAELLRLFRLGMLLQVVTPEGKAVAADLLLPHGTVLFNVAGGVLDADPQYYEQGVLSALYYFEIEWAFRNGLRLFDSGESRPLLSDGVYRHKQRWGMTAIEDWREANAWLFWLPTGSTAAQAWLANHPFDLRFVRWHTEANERFAHWQQAFLRQSIEESG